MRILKQLSKKSAFSGPYLFSTDQFGRPLYYPNGKFGRAFLVPDSDLLEAVTDFREREGRITNFLSMGIFAVFFSIMIFDLKAALWFTFPAIVLCLAKAVHYHLGHCKLISRLELEVYEPETATLLQVFGALFAALFATFELYFVANRWANLSTGVALVMVVQVGFLLLPAFNLLLARTTFCES